MMKSIRLAFVYLLSLFALIGCNKEELEITLEVNKTAYEVKVGGTLDLSKEVKVSNTNEAPSFKSSDPKVATVSENGLVEGLVAGQVKITVSVANKKTIVNVTVSDVVAGSISLDCPETLQVGEDLWATVKATVTPSDYNLDNLQWKFEADPLLEAIYEKVSASEYKIHFGAYLENAGMTVTVKDKNSNVSATATIVALEPEPEEVEAKRISLDYPTSITEGEEAWGTITASVTPSDYNPENLEWAFEFSPEGIADVDADVKRISASEYQVRFPSFVENGKVNVTVTDKVSGKAQYASIAVEKKPLQGVETLSITPESLTVFVGADPVSLQVVTSPADYDRALLNWTTTDENVVTILNGTLTIVGEGQATVKVKDSITGLEAEMAVNVVNPVTEVEVKSIVLNQNRLTLKLGSSAVQLVATCYDENGNVVENYAELEWTVEKMQAEVGRIDVVELSQSGVVTPKNMGSTVITVANKNNGQVKATCNVSVVGVLPTGISLSSTTLVLPTGMVYSDLNATISPENTDYPNITWTSSDPTVAEVDGSGNITTLAEGTTTITASTYDGSYTASCKVEVTSASFAISFEMDATAAAGLVQGTTLDIDATYVGLDGGAYQPSSTSWSSSNPSVATVDENGVVTALATEAIDDAGVEVVITHTADGEQATLTIKIIRALPESVTITSYPTDYKMYVGDSFELKAAVNPSAADQFVKWMCYNSADEMSWTHIDLTTGVFTPTSVGYYSIDAFSAYEYRDAYNVLHTFSHIRTSIGVQVLPIDIVTANLNMTQLNMIAGNTASLSVTISPENATYKDIDWSSSNESVVEVSSTGILTAVANGSAVITARQEENDITLTCTVNVIERTQNFNVGDYYYSDGSISSELVQGKTVIGVVCSLNDVTGHDQTLRNDHPSYSNGLVLALQDAPKVKWQGYGASISNWAVNNGFGTLVGAKSNSGVATETVGVLTAEGEKMRGYNNTKAIKAYMATDDYASKSDDYKVYLFDGWSVEDPAATSGWFVPSIAEMIVIAQNYVQLEQKITAAGGDSFDAEGYWTSTENDGVGSWAVYMDILNNKFYANRSKSNTHKVRYIFAF